MEKNVLVLIKISNKKILITAIENFNSSNIEVFSDTINPNDNDNCVEFIKSSIKKIEDLILAKIKEVSIIFDATNYAEVKQKLISEKISNLNNRIINNDDFVTALEKVKQFYSDDNLEEYIPILFQPFQFNLTDENNSKKIYYQLPLGKKANELEILFSVTTLKKKYYYSILHICKKANLNITQIYSSSNTSPHILENNEKKNVSITLQVEKHYSNLIITNNGVTIVTKNLKYTFEDLCNKIANEFKISKKLVYNLIITEGIITKDIKELSKIIFHKKNISIKVSQLTPILKSFIKTLIKEIDYFIKLKYESLKNYSLNIIGRVEKIEKIEEYCNSILTNNEINVNNRPINYLLLNYNNRSIFSLIKMLENTKKIINVNTLNANTKFNTIPQKSWLKPLSKKNISLLSK